MSIVYVRADAVCDKCDSGYTVIVQALVGPKGVRAKLRAAGWHCWTSKDYCPNCHPVEKPR